MGLDQGHLAATLGQFDRRGDAGEAAADDGDVDRHRAQQGRIVGFLVERGGVVDGAFRPGRGWIAAFIGYSLFQCGASCRRAAVCGRVRGGSGLGQVPAPVLLADLAHELPVFRALHRQVDAEERLAEGFPRPPRCRASRAVSQSVGRRLPAWA